MGAKNDYHTQYVSNAGCRCGSLFSWRIFEGENPPLSQVLHPRAGHRRDDLLHRELHPLHRGDMELQPGHRHAELVHDALLHEHRLHGEPAADPAGRLSSLQNGHHGRDPHPSAKPHRDLHGTCIQPVPDDGARGRLDPAGRRAWDSRLLRPGTGRDGAHEWHHHRLCGCHLRSCLRQLHRRPDRRAIGAPLLADLP